MDICICITDSLCCTLETNTTLQVNYTPIIKKKEEEEEVAGWIWSWKSM